MSAGQIPTRQVAGLDEQIRDVVGALLVAGANVSITVNDAGDTVTVAATNTTDPEVVRDTIGAALVAGTGISITVNDAGDTITIAATGGGSTDPEVVRDTMAAALVAGAGVTITVDDAGDTITLASTGGGGVGAGLVDYQTASRTAGNISCVATAITELSPTAGGLDLALRASVGDIVGLGISGLVNTGNQSIGIAGYTMVAGSRVNAIGNALSASLAGACGVSPWYTSAATAEPEPLAGEVPYTVQAGDLDTDGLLHIRLHYAKATTTARTINATTAFPFRVWAKNYGQPISAGVWTNFTPTLNNFAATVNFARYKVDGRTCRVQVALTLTAAPTGRLEVSAPVTALATLPTGNMGPVGTCIGNDVGTARRLGAAFFLAGNVIAFGSDGVTSFWGTSTPHVWASGDTVAFEAVFEMA